jgi:hypothetical protein
LRGVEPACTHHDSVPIEAFELLVDDPESSTFHGRDVFAPAAAEIHEAGVQALSDCPFVSAIETYTDLRFPSPEHYEEGVVGEVLVVDDFGNAITNVPGSVLDDLNSVRLNDDPVPVGTSFGAVPKGQWLVTIGSHGNVELAVNHGRGDEAFGVEPGDSIWIEFAAEED